MTHEKIKDLESLLTSDQKLDIENALPDLVENFGVNEAEKKKARMVRLMVENGTSFGNALDAVTKAEKGGVSSIVREDGTVEKINPDTKDIYQTPKKPDAD